MINKFYKLTLIFTFFTITSCTQLNVTPAIEADFKPTVSVNNYGYLKSGEKIQQYQLTAKNIKLSVINLGGIITHLEVPDKKGNFEDVVLGYDHLSDYENKNRYFGVILGRYANRISEGKAVIGADEFQLSTNRPPHQLHGGHKGFDKVVWNAKTSVTADSSSIVLTYSSADGEEGYPGKLDAKVTYTITNSSELIVTYEGETNKTTVYNPSQHSYFNLSGKGDDVLEHNLVIHANEIVELDGNAIPTGELLSVNNTDFDFLTITPVSQILTSSHAQVKMANQGMDHFYKSKNKRGKLSLLAELSEPTSGRNMKVFTTEVGAQFYSANYLNNSVIGKNKKPYKKWQGLCIETGQMPNAPAEKNFNTVLVEPNKLFFSQTVFSFNTL